VNITDKRWAQLAEQLKLQQLDGARRQAESWRTGLGSLTALLAAVTIVKGPDTIGELSGGWRITVVVLLGLAFAALTAGTLLAVRAAGGRPEAMFLTGPNLKAWTRREVRAVRRAIQGATALLVVGLVLVAVAIGATWLLPREQPAHPSVQVVTVDTHACGELVSVDRAAVTLDLDPGPKTRTLLLPHDRLVSITPVASC
jgi:hypothetical protein